MPKHSPPGAVADYGAYGEGMRRADLQPPVARRVPKITVIHGDRLQDHYAWLRERDNPEVRAYLEAENAYTDAVMKPTEPLQDALYRELDRRGIEIFANEGSPAVAVNDGVIKKVGENSRLGRHIVLQDVYGNRFTYAHLGSVSRSYPVPKEDATNPEQHARAISANDKKPSRPASAGRQLDTSDSVTSAWARVMTSFTSRLRSSSGSPRRSCRPCRGPRTWS